MTVTDAELEQLEKQIDQKKAEETAPVNTQVTPEPPQPVQEQTSPVDPVETPPEQKENNGEGFDPAAYVKAKGWKTPEDAARSLRELEKKFHESNQKKEVPQIPQIPQGYQPTGYQQPPQAYQPTPPMQPYGYPQQAYQPPANPWGPAPRITEEQVAASYGMSIEDFRRVATLARDLSEAQMRQFETSMQRKMEETNRQNERANDMTQVFADPAFHSPDVQAEIHEILSKNPELMNERKTYSIALNQALQNLGRRNLTGGNRAALNQVVQTTPPEMGGSRGAGGSLPGKRGLSSLPSLKELEGKSADEIEKILKASGLNRTHMDY
jgi:hypothetical protein